jgi:hypothetical protein
LLDSGIGEERTLNFKTQSNTYIIISNTIKKYKIKIVENPNLKITKLTNQQIKRQILPN